jgi:hypothetical protein
VAVEKGTKAVISPNFSVHGERTFNLQTNFILEIPEKSFSTATPVTVNEQRSRGASMNVEVD